MSVQSIYVGFRAKQHEHMKLQEIAAGEGCTVSDVLRQLVQRAPVQPVQRKVDGLAFTNAKSATQVSKATGDALAR